MKVKVGEGLARRCVHARVCGCVSERAGWNTLVHFLRGGKLLATLRVLGQAGEDGAWRRPGT